MYKINKRVHKQIDLFFKKSLVYVCMYVSTFYGYTNVRVHKYVSVLTYSLFSFVCYALEIYTDFFFEHFRRIIWKINIKYVGTCNHTNKIVQMWVNTYIYSSYMCVYM